MREREKERAKRKRKKDKTSILLPWFRDFRFDEIFWNSQPSLAVTSLLSNEVLIDKQL